MRVVAIQSGNAQQQRVSSRKARRDVNAKPLKALTVLAPAPVSSQGPIRKKRPSIGVPQQQQYQQSSIVPLYRAPRPQWQMAVQQQQHQQFPAWAERYRRQVRSLPQGVAALHNLLHSVEHLLQKAEHCGSHSGVMKAYLGLGLVDLTSQAWQQRMAQLQEQQSKMPAELHKQQLLTAELALAGCRFMRLEAAHELAKQLHVLLDDEGYCPSLNLAALPAPHALGLGVPALLRKGLGLDLQNPAIRIPESSATDSLCNLSWEEYTAVSADQSMCGDWQFCYWVGDATWVPAPFGKFSTSELAAVLTPDAVLASLANGIWGRALITAAQEQGVQVGSARPSTQQEAAQQQQLQRSGALGAAAAGMPEAVKALLEESMGGSNFRARMRQFSSAVAAVRSNLIGGSVPAPGTQNN